MKKIILVGYMGSGKSEIGKTLSKKINLSFLDLDDLIEKELFKTINQIFADEGEVYFRKFEHQVFFKKVNANESFVLSLGGGTPCYANNHELLKNRDVISIYLKASVDTLKNRLQYQKAKRPLLKDLSEDELSEYIAKHLFDRSYYYNQCKYIVGVDGKTPNEIVAEIEKLLA
jgi:shikimate kinase